MNMDASVVIALAAVFIAVATPIIQIIYMRKGEWHNARGYLLRSLSSIYDDIIFLINNPHTGNDTSFMVCLRQRVLLLDHSSQRFILKRKIIESARKIVIDKLMELTLIPEYEEIIINGKGSKTYVYFELLNKIRGEALRASEVLID